MQIAIDAQQKPPSYPIDFSRHTFTVNFFLCLQPQTLGKNLKKDAKTDRTLDCLGLFCPEPVYRTRLELDKMKCNEILEVWADDPAAERDIQSLVKRLNHKILEIKKEGNTLHILIKKGK